MLLRALKFSTTLLALSMLPLALHAAAIKQSSEQPAPYIEGKDYTKLSSKVRSSPGIESLIQSDPHKVQVLYFFNYGCPACAHFDPGFEEWIHQRPGNVVVYKFPVLFNDEWKNLAKLYFVMKLLDPNENLNTEIFSAIQDQKQELWQQSEMENFFIQNHFSQTSFEKAYDSSKVNNEVKRSDQLSIEYAITQTPTIIINGATNSYKMNPGKNGADREEFFKIMNYLIQTEPS